jgi:hypothetical protein
MAKPPPIETAKARDLLAETIEILPAENRTLINPLVYTNAGKLNDAAFRRWLLWANVARDVTLLPALFGRYPAPAYLDGAGPFTVHTSGRLVEEQAGIGLCDTNVVWRSMAPRMAKALDVDRPCLLACRHGEWTWGHWLIDMLPKIVLAEWFSPKRFTYVVPAGITDPGSGHFYVANVLESLAAYGIGPERLLRVRNDAVYRFSNLFDIADATTDGVHSSLHPGVITAMQAVKTVPERPRVPLTAVLRSTAEHRPVVNGAAIAAVLHSQNAAVMDPGATPFATQIRAFRDSDIIVGDLGSNLAASIYARPGSGLVTLAPTGWEDTYFAGIFQRLGAFHADIRGASMPAPGQALGHAPYAVNPADLIEGLQAVRAALAAPPGAPIVAGRVVARAPGEIVWQIRFGKHGDAAPYQRGLFSPPEELHTWSMGPSCRIVVPDARPPRGDLWLEVKGVGFVGRPHLVSRALGVAVNGKLLANFDIEELTHVHVKVPAAVLAGHNGLDLEFRTPVCPSPLSIGVSGDTRPLGFMFERLALRKA